MKMISMLLAAGALLPGPVARAQDAAVEEKLRRLSVQLEDLQDARVKLEKMMGDLTREMASLREQAAKPAGNFASPEDLRKLAEQLQDVDRKRIADNEKILAAIEKLSKAGGRTEKPPPSRGDSAGPPGGGKSDKWFEYVIQDGDTLSAICQAYREKGIKLTPEEILKANPGLKATSLRIGQKIYIPAP